VTAVTADHHVPATPTQHGPFRRYVFGPGWIRAAWMFCLLGAVGFGLTVLARWGGGWHPILYTQPIILI